MKSNRIVQFLSLLVPPLIVLACGMGSPQPAVTDEPNAAAPIAVTGLCANQYYPVRQGATWTYKSTGGPSGEYTFSDTITSVRDDGFTLTSQFTDLTRTQEWACRDEGLVALQLGGGTAAALSTSGSTLEMQTQNAQGVTFPKTINAGDAWQHTLDFTGTMNIAGETAEASGSANAQFTALGMESVTVPAGTFNAIKVQVNNTMTITATFQGVTVPVEVSGTTTSWFVQGVGWVKSETSGSFSGTSFSETIELQTYNIP